MRRDRALRAKRFRYGFVLPRKASTFVLVLSLVIPFSVPVRIAMAENALSAQGGAGPNRFDVVVLDAGHGGHDEGATGPSGLREKDLVLDVTRQLAKRF